MADIVSPEKRSQMMAGIKGKNTKPELAIRSALHSLGFRFRLHVRKLPGKPDLVFSKYKVLIFVHGCFWHGHNCHLFKLPTTRVEFWQNKIYKNREVDVRNIEQLTAEGWRIGIIWECSIRGKSKLPFDYVIESCKNWIISKERNFQIHGKT
jgi:DNA mismatch endonuclease, patch repair protein